MIDNLEGTSKFPVVNRPKDIEGYLKFIQKKVSTLIINKIAKALLSLKIFLPRISECWAFLKNLFIRFKK